MENSSSPSGSTTDLEGLSGSAASIGLETDPQIPVHGTRARQREETRERIFETALSEFREVGLAAARIERIAKKAGVARGTFYFHFPTKDDVLLELARRINNRIIDRIATIVQKEPDLREFLLRVSDVLIDEHERIGQAGLHAELMSLYILRPYDLRDPIHNVPTLSEELGRYLAVIAQRGELKTTLAVEQMSTVIMSSLFGVLARVNPGEEMREACLSLIELLARGLRAGK